MLGKLIEEKGLANDEVTNYEIGWKYASGVYNIIVQQEEFVESIRVIKR